ncbi:terminase small subunit [Bacillus pacificus]|uniref:terminase small subunit n=1 Tax=Bacillus pacificus TaxID=2026187 RepID=UPI001E5C27BF|nr:terminase small subunit [Bacillus pacificus]MCC2471954.1 terminase small subunit [Bacillus pacificus]
MSNQSEKTPKTKNSQKVKGIASSKTLRDWRELDTSITLSPSPQDNDLQFHMNIPIELSASLNLKQQDFLHNLLETKMNISKAAEMSGISESYGRKITQMPNARAYLSALRNQRAATSIMSYTELLSELSAIARGNETDDSSRITKISPLKGYGEVDSALAQQIKEKDPLTYRRLRANDLKDIPKTDAYYESEIYSENCPVEVFDAYIVRPSKDPQSPRYAEDWMGHYENLTDYEKGDSIHLKQTVNLYSTENLRGMAQEIRDIQKEIETIEKEIY